ncbi:MAG TPA: cytochrome c oxidase subunit 3 [Kofleriaceae bacterium]
MSDERRYRLAVWIVIASEALLFAGLFALYAAYRVQYPQAFAAGVRADLAWVGAGGTFLLITSSFAIAAAVQRGGSRPALAVTFVLGATFLVLKAIEWSDHIAHGIVPGAFGGPPGSALFTTLYYGMTGLHALHVVVGLALVAWVFVRGKRLPLVALYWHFVDVVWVFLWPLFYLLRGG